MTTAAERLVFLSGFSSETASVHLISIGTGTTAAERLINFSGLSSNTAATHLLFNREPVAFGGYWMILKRRRRI